MPDPTYEKDRELLRQLDVVLNTYLKGGRANATLLDLIDIMRSSTEKACYKAIDNLPEKQFMALCLAFPLLRDVANSNNMRARFLVEQFDSIFTPINKNSDLIFARLQTYIHESKPNVQSKIAKAQERLAAGLPLVGSSPTKLFSRKAKLAGLAGGVATRSSESDRTLGSPSSSTSSISTDSTKSSTRNTRRKF